MARKKKSKQEELPIENGEVVLENKETDNDQEINIDDETDNDQEIDTDEEAENDQEISIDDEADNDQEIDTDEEAESEEDYESLRQKLIDEYNNKKPLTSENDESEEPEEEHLDSDDFIEEEEPEVDDDYTSEQDLENEDLNLEPEYKTEEANIENKLDLVQEDTSNNPSLTSDINNLYQNTAPDVDQGQSKVAVGNKKSILIFVALILVVLFAIYKFFQSNDPEPVQPASQVDKNIPITKPVEDTGQAIVVPQLPKVPDVPKLPAPTPPPAPVPPTVADLSIPQPKAAAAEVVNPFNKNDKSNLERRKTKITSSMIVGGSEGKTNNKNTNKDGKSLSILARNTDQVVATNIGDLRRVIAQGKIIDATLETAINTDLPGNVRALVSRDIYSESGKNILIPRGSRLIGDYSSTVSFGINRLKINWSRLIRPDGVDINIASSGIDQIGRAGVPGDLNNHIVGTLTAAVLTSVIDIGVAAFADTQTSTNSSTTTFSPTATATNTTNGNTQTIPTINTGGTITTGSTPTQKDTAYQNAVSQIGSTGQNIVEQYQNMKPTITIDQGAPLKVFVNKDLVFPGSSANLTKVIE